MSVNLSMACGDLTRINEAHKGNLAGIMGIEIVAVGQAFIRGRMPVERRNMQPFGLLHGGASIVLAETLGSLASYLLIAGEEGVRVAGAEVGGSHLRAVRSGQVYGLCRPLKIGRTLHTWAVEVRDDPGRLCCVARLTVSVGRLENSPP